LARTLDKSRATADGPRTPSGWAPYNPARTVLVVCLVTAAARILLVILSNSGFGENFALDDETYLRLANAQASGDLSGWGAYELQLWQSTLTYMWPLKVLLELFGSSAWLSQLYTATWGVGTVALATIVATRFLNGWTAMAVGVTLALLPSQVLWSSLVLKDAAVWTLLALLGLLCLVCNSSGLRGLLLSIAGVAVALWGLGHLRDHTLIVAGWSIPIALACGVSALRTVRVGSGVVLALAVPWLLGLGPGGWTLLTDPNLAERRLANAQGALSAYIDARPAPADVGSNELEQINAILATLTQELEEINQRLERTNDPELVAELKEKKEQIESEVGELQAKADENPDPAPGQAGASETVTEDSLDANLKHLPRGLVVMLLEPVPWRTPTSSNMNLARWENLVWYPLLLLAAIGLFGARKYLHALAFPILAGGGMLIAYALSEGNIGTAYRHRGESVWAIVLLAGLGAQMVHERWQQRREEHHP
jgi:hypothetical protein